MKFSLILLFFWTHSIAAQTPASKFAAGKLLSEENPAANSLPVQPDPSNLKADWWRYFEVEPDALKSNSAAITEKMNAFLENPVNYQEPDIKANIQKITENVRVLTELRTKTGPEMPVSGALQINYTLAQWLEIIHKYRAMQAEMQSENEDFLREEKRLSVLSHEYDSMTAAYLTLPNHTRGKSSQGLALMAAWTELAVNRERLRLKKASLAVQKAQLDQIGKESVVSQNRLFISADELRRLKQEVEAAERASASAQDYASQLSSSLAISNVETDEGKTRASIFKQRVKDGVINEAIAETVVARKKIELLLARIVNGSEKTQFAGIRIQLQEHLDLIVEINDKFDTWREEAERDQVRAGKTLAALFGDNTQRRNELITLAQERLTQVQNTLLSLQRLDGEIHDARLVAAQVGAIISSQEGALKSSLESVKTTTTKMWDMVWIRLETSLFKIGETPVTILGILRVVLILTLAWIFSHAVRRGLTHLSERQQGSSAFLYALGRLTHYFILIIGISIGLSSIGVDLSNFALIAGALSLGVGFGLQAIVSNFVSGLILLFERSLRIGDFVELSSGEAGEVRAVNVRSTLVTTTDMVDILVPNSEFVNGKVINWTLTDASRRIHIPFGVAYGSEKDLVRKAGLEAAEQVPYTVKNKPGREPEVWLVKFGESSLDFELIVWVQPYAVKKPQRVRAAYYWELETALKSFGIQIPFPQRDIHLHTSKIRSVQSTYTDNSPK